MSEPASGGAGCPVCSAPALPRLQVAGEQYLSCAACEHLFIPRQHEARFGAAFYNSPGYLALEAQWPAEHRLILFRQAIEAGTTALGHEPAAVLDYGAGQQDIDEKRAILPVATFYDPFARGSHRSPPEARQAFDFVVLTEVLEHVFDPVQVLQSVRGFSRLCIATTLLSDFQFTLKYLIPEGGHVSIFSLRSIQEAAQRAGFQHEIRFWPGQHQYYYHLLTGV